MSRDAPPPFVLAALNPRHQAGLQRLQSRPEVFSRLGRIVETQDTLASGVRAIESDGEVVGVVGLVRSGALDGTEIELICALIEAHEGRGIATAACHQLLVAEAHRHARQRVLASIASDNAAGKGLAERLGFKRIGTRGASSDELWAISLADLLIAAG